MQLEKVKSIKIGFSHAKFSVYLLFNDARQTTKTPTMRRRIFLLLKGPSIWSAILYGSHR